MMKCTACSSGNLNAAYLESLLPCYTCSECGGSLLMMSDYFRWRELNCALEFESTVSVEADEHSKALMCPKTGGFMVKYRISKDTDHRLDLSPAINAVWMDKGEWELLKANGLAGQLSGIFTDHWQRDIHAQESAELMREMYARRFGDDYVTLKGVRQRLQAMGNRSEALAYLMADDPYRP